MSADPEVRRVLSLVTMEFRVRDEQKAAEETRENIRLQKARQTIELRRAVAELIRQVPDELERRGFAGCERHPVKDGVINIPYWFGLRTKTRSLVREYALLPIGRKVTTPRLFYIVATDGRIVQTDISATGGPSSTACEAVELDSITHLDFLQEVRRELEALVCTS